MTSTVIPAFANHLPVRIRFGEGMGATLPAAIAELGTDQVFLMVDEGIEVHNPAVAALLADVAKADGLTVVRFDKPAGEPTIAMVDDAIAALAASGAGVVVALGGGSVIDTAKAARLGAQLGVTFREFINGAPTYPVATVPLIAIPTSAGTGSEVSGGAVVSDPESGRKAGIANANLRAQIALVDPLLTYSMPPTMTANTGVDALAQAIAGMVAKCRTPIGDAIALEAIRMMTPGIVAAYRDGTDAAARAAMSCGSMMAGLTMNISDCTAEHSLGQAIGGLKHVPHGLTIGLVLVETLDPMRWVSRTSAARTGRVPCAPFSGCSPNSTSPCSAAWGSPRPTSTSCPTSRSPTSSSRSLPCRGARTRSSLPSHQPSPCQRAEGLPTLVAPRRGR
ncbi:MAG: iron-containing alcohol dehydrogenase [Actinobacteria bacterium]|nr:iron-containing alcohol dehydrogenase [Actinomycetota bacterium]